jgi:hypothetical protein
MHCDGASTVTAAQAAARKYVSSLVLHNLGMRYLPPTALFATASGHANSTCDTEPSRQMSRAGRMCLRQATGIDGIFDQQRTYHSEIAKLYVDHVPMK